MGLSEDNVDKLIEQLLNFQLILIVDLNTIFKSKFSRTIKWKI